MTKNRFIICAVLCALALALSPRSAIAQETNAPAAPTAAPAPPPARPNPQHNLMILRAAVATLDRTMAELQRNDNDFNGHRQAAIDACAKARAELADIAQQAGIPLLRQPGAAGAARRPLPPGGEAQPAAPAPPPPAAQPQQ